MTRSYRIQRLASWLLIVLVPLLAAAALARQLELLPALVVACVLALLLAAVVGAREHAPYAAQLRALSSLVAAWRDSDFSTSIREPDSAELAELTRVLNGLGDALRAERQRLMQRELLLDTVIQHTPTAVVLADPHARIVFANVAARELFARGRKLEGHGLSEILTQVAAPLRDALAAGADALCTLPPATDTVGADSHGDATSDETFHVARRQFVLNGRRHELILIKRMTRELVRQEVATWKKVIRVISHELNNALAPISSLAHSGKQLIVRGDSATLVRVFDTIEERARHLDSFIRGYATFAKLPLPRIEQQRWSELLGHLSAQVQIVVIGTLPEEPVGLDPGQFSQAMLNLVRNAEESGSAAGSVEIEVRAAGDSWRLDVRDRGAGMSDTVLQNALLPFYSTKRSGTGLGLALTREIVEAHGGRIALSNRDSGGLMVSLWWPRGRATRRHAAPTSVTG